MLVLTRGKDMAVRIGNEIVVAVREFTADSVVVHVDCPAGLILRNAQGEIPGDPCGANDAHKTTSTGLKCQSATIPLTMEEVLSIGDEITVKVLAFDNMAGHSPKVRLGFRAPASLRIVRTELDHDGSERATVEIHIEQGDLTSYRVDAIVNAANNDLILGGGLAGAISRRGGPQIQAECDRHGPVAVGEAAITGAGDLPAKFVIHQASMRLGGRTTAQSLLESTRAVLRLAQANGVRTLAMPATGTGIAGFDLNQCARIMLGEVLEFARSQTGISDVYFVLYDPEACQTFLDVYREMVQKTKP